MVSEVLNKIADFFGQFEANTYEKDEIIITPGKAPRGLFYLEEGIVRQYTISKAGEELVINTFKSPAFFPVDWIINDTPVRYYFETMNKVIVRIAPKQTALDFLKSNHDVVFNLMQRIYKGLEGYFVRIENLMTGTARARLVSYLLMHAKRFSKDHLKLTEQEIASGSGLSRETVSRQLHILKTDGLVSFEKGFLNISDVNLLEKEISLDTL